MERTRTLGEVIRERRIALNLTQEELAERIGDGVRQAEVSRLERGRVSLPRRRRLERIAAALDVSLGELLAHAGWAEADHAFAPTPDRSPPPVGASAPPAEPATLGVSRGEWAVASAQLRAALERSQELEARTAELLRQSDSLAMRWLTRAVAR